MNDARKPPFSVDAQQKARYDETYFAHYRNDPRRDAMYERERARIEQIKPEGGRILDIGCGLGLFLERFAAPKWERYGVEISDSAAQEARQRGVRVNAFESAYDYAPEYFDVVVFRGTLQLIPTPFSVIKDCVRLLAPGGLMAFLATPNSNSPYYRRFKTLPFLTPHANFLIPSDLMMRNALQNFGLEIISIEYPYLDTPYASPLRDHAYYLLSFLGLTRKFAFWRSMMEIYSRKPRA
jgi:2-polyprenyl-3-methyl-5-hydroxy-6-metoxy-1,4-benzoquinol methylase